MILIDDRVGSKELLPLFGPFGVHVESTRLESADIRFVGNGPDGDCMVGIERKRISDLVQSMRSKRLSGHQLSPMFQDHALNYLFVEGVWRPGKGGELEELRGREFRPFYNSGRSVLYREVDNYLATLEMKIPVDHGVAFVIRRTSNAHETVVQIVDLYRHWSEKLWSEHRSHLQMYAPPPETLLTRKVSYMSPEETMRRRHGEQGVMVWKMAAQLDGVDRKAELVANEFKTVRRMVNATLKDWERIKGIGKVLAERIDALLGEE